MGILSKAPTSLALSTPPEWTTIDLRLLGDEDAFTAQLAPLGALGAALAAGLALARELTILFAAMVSPGDGKSDDLSIVTLSEGRATPPHDERYDAEPNSAGASTATRGSSTTTLDAPDLTPVVLPCGPAARSERYSLVRIVGLAQVPAYTVEYSVLAEQQALLLAFTTIAPSDIDALREQFASIAMTLELKVRDGDIGPDTA